MLDDQEFLARNSKVSEELGCTSLEGYLQILKDQYGIKRTDCEFHMMDIELGRLLCPQPGYAQTLYDKVTANLEYLKAPIIVVRTHDNIKFYLIAGNARAKVAYDMGGKSLPAIVIYTFNATLENWLAANSMIVTSNGKRPRRVADLKPVQQ